MQQNATPPDSSTGTGAIKQRGFWLPVQPSLLSFSLSNDKANNALLSGIKFDLPSKATVGSQQASVGRSISIVTFVKSYSCLSPDVFVLSISSADLKRSAVTSETSANDLSDEGGSGPSSQDIAAIHHLLEDARHSRTDFREHKDPSLPPRLIVVTEDSLFDGMQSSGVPPPQRPP